MEKICRRALVALALVTPLAIAAPTQETTQACTEIKNALPGKVLTPGLLAAEYLFETGQYWSTALRSVDPACIVQPVDAKDVSTVVKILLRYPTVKFATRSGGHDPNVGHASVEDGVLIAMTDMVGATYDAATGLASVKPGGQWNDVVGDLEPNGVTILGGRLGELVRTDKGCQRLTRVRRCWCWWLTARRWPLIPLSSGRISCR
jgi:hypothetical protein